MESKDDHRLQGRGPEARQCRLRLAVAQEQCVLWPSPALIYPAGGADLPVTASPSLLLHRSGCVANWRCVQCFFPAHWCIRRAAFAGLLSPTRDPAQRRTDTPAESILPPAESGGEASLPVLPDKHRQT